MSGERPFRPHATSLVVAMLSLIVGVEFFHRQLLAIALPDIQRDLGIADGEAGALLMAFALAYLVVALILGRLADRRSQSEIYTLSLLVWSGGTALGALAAGYAGFGLTRAVVGAAQGGAGAVNAPLVADYVGPDRRGTAMGVVGIGGTFGSMLGLALGGYWVASFGWRETFVLGGAVGAVFALFFRAIVKEPPRGWSEGRPPPARHPGLREVLGTLAGLRTLRHLATAAVLASMAIMATAQWGPAFFDRVHGLPPEEAGVFMGVIALLGTIGPVAGGILTDRLWAKRPGAALRMSGICAALACPAAIVAVQTDRLWLAAAAFTVSVILGIIHAAQIGAVSQALVPVSMRGVTAAVLAATLTAFGFGIGPFVTGLLSDLAGGDAHGLRLALTGMSLFYAWAAVHFEWASRSLEEELSRAGQP